MEDVLDRPRPASEPGALELIGDISELHLDARRRLMELIYRFQERERQLEDEIRRLRDLLASTYR